MSLQKQRLIAKTRPKLATMFDTNSMFLHGGFFQTLHTHTLTRARACAHTGTPPPPPNSARCSEIGSPTSLMHRPDLHAYGDVREPISLHQTVHTRAHVHPPPPPHTHTHARAHARIHASIHVQPQAP